MIERLFPKAYLDPTEEGREREYAALVHADLMRSRLDRLAEVVATLEPLTHGTKPQTIALDEDDRAGVARRAERRAGWRSAWPPV